MTSKMKTVKRKTNVVKSSSKKSKRNDANENEQKIIIGESNSMSRLNLQVVTASTEVESLQKQNFPIELKLEGEEIDIVEHEIETLMDDDKPEIEDVKWHKLEDARTENYSMEEIKEEEQQLERKVHRKFVLEDGMSLGRNVKVEQKYACDLCSKVYSRKFDLETHIRRHTLEKPPFKCDVCGFKSMSRESTLWHIIKVHLIVHSNEPLDNYTTRKDAVKVAKNCLSAKKKRTVLRTMYECAVCATKSSHKPALLKHVKEKHQNAYMKFMKNHDGSQVPLIGAPTEKLTIRCEHCSMIFHDTWKYGVHLRSHTGVKPFSCSVCEFRATRKMTIRDHIHRRHVDIAQPKIFMRTVCIDGEVQEVALAVPRRVFKCEFCEEILKDNYSLRTHKLKQHKYLLPFQCLECNRKDLTKANTIMHCLKEHVGCDLDNLIMKNGRPVKIGPVLLPICKICNKVFSYKSQLNKHLRLHTGEKLFPCENCAYKTDIKGLLDNHIKKVHLGIKVAKK